MYGLSSLFFTKADLAAAGLIEEENVPGSPKIHHRHSSIMSNPPEPEVILEGKKRQVLDDVMAVSLDLYS